LNKTPFVFSEKEESSYFDRSGVDPNLSFLFYSSKRVVASLFLTFFISFNKMEKKISLDFEFYHPLFSSLTIDFQLP